MPIDPNRRDVLTWLTATAAIGCAPGSMALPSKSTFQPEGSGALGPGSADDTAAPVDTADGAGGDTGSTFDSGDDGSTDVTDVTDDAWTCDQGDTPTPDTCRPSTPQGEGPYYLEDTPEGAQMNRRGADDTRLTVDLRVLGPDCTPQEGVVVDLWHADETETYDMTADFHCRGRLVTGADGSVCFQTLRPPPYGDGTSYLPAHLHLNLLKEGIKLLTTQLYFSDCPYLADAPPELVCTPQFAEDGSQRIQVDLILPVFA